jgi:sulfate adenylyltransferase subunit 1
MDLVDYSEERFKEIRQEFRTFSSKLDVPDIHYIPISALFGDNVVDKSDNMPWYGGSTLLYTLENVQVDSDYNHVDSRFPVQWVTRPQSTEYPDYRGYAGKVAGGVFKPGDEIIALPSGFTSKIDTIETFENEEEEAFTPMSVTMTLEDEIDISRGDMIAKPDNQPTVGQDIALMVCWLHKEPIDPNGKYVIRHTTKEARCIIKEVKYKVNINTLHRVEGDKEIGLNDIGRIKIRTTEPLFYDSYNRNRKTGSLILIDQFTNETVGAGMITER